MEHTNKIKSVDLTVSYDDTLESFDDFVRFPLLLQKFRFNDYSLFLTGNMDGRTSNKDLKRKFEEKFKRKLTGKRLNSFVKRLKKQKLLVGKKNNCFLSSLSSSYLSPLLRKHRAAFKKMKTRNAVFDGEMYAADPKDLNRQLDICFASVDEKKLQSLLKNTDELKGLVVPHSNIELSGPCAAWAYKTIELTAFPDLIILITPNHELPIRYPFSVCAKSFRTPLGLVKVDNSFVNKLAKKCLFNIFQDDFAHASEHAIEIQLPFLQFIYRRAHHQFAIVPIVCSSYSLQSFDENFEKLKYHFLISLQKCIFTSGKRVLVIASGDLHHQKTWKVSENFHKKNQEIIKLMKKANGELLKKYLSTAKYLYTCCENPFLVFLKLLRPKQGLLLNYSWSGKFNSLKKKNKKYKYISIEQIGFMSMFF